MDQSITIIDDALRVYNDINNLKHSTFEITDGDKIGDDARENGNDADLELSQKIRGTTPLPIKWTSEVLTEHIKEFVQHSRRNLSALMLTNGHSKSEWEPAVRCLYDALRWSPQSEPTLFIYDKPLSGLLDTFPNLRFTGENASCMMKVYPSAITPALYIGGISSAHSATVLNRTRVTHVVNCTKDMPNFFEPPPPQRALSQAASALRGAGKSLGKWLSNAMSSNDTSFPRPQASHTPFRWSNPTPEPDVDPPMGVQYFRVPVDDHYVPIQDFFDESFQFITDALESNKSNEEKAEVVAESTEEHRSRNVVLIHCVCGISRSVTILIHYLMRTRRLKFDEAYNFVRSMREEARPNRHFETLLKDVEKGMEM